MSLFCQGVGVDLPNANPGRENGRVTFSTPDLYQKQVKVGRAKKQEQKKEAEGNTRGSFPSDKHLPKVTQHFSQGCVFWRSSPHSMGDVCRDRFEYGAIAFREHFGKRTTFPYPVKKVCVTLGIWRNGEATPTAPTKTNQRHHEQSTKVDFTKPTGPDIMTPTAPSI